MCSVKGVWIHPGRIAFARIPNFASWMADARVKCRIPARDIAYAEPYSPANFPAMDDMLTIASSACFFHSWDDGTSSEKDAGGADVHDASPLFDIYLVKRAAVLSAGEVNQDVDTSEGVYCLRDYA